MHAINDNVYMSTCIEHDVASRQAGASKQRSFMYDIQHVHAGARSRAFQLVDGCLLAPAVDGPARSKASAQ